MENIKHEQGRLIRIHSTDIKGETKIYPGLTKIKGVSWAMSGYICKKLKIDKNKRIGSLSEEEKKKIEEFLKNPDKETPNFLMNRQKDFETGENKHLTGSKLDLQKEFDIRRLKKIKNYKGLRHLLKLPLRGQKTKSNFRKNKMKGVGIKKKKKQ